MSKYDTPNVPPSTPPVIAPQADPAEAARAPVDGDSEVEGSAESGNSPAEGAGANDARSQEMVRRDKRDGLGEEGMDAAAPDDG